MNHAICHRDRSRRSRAGFSLVEVALALGIAAFALIAIFGLLPVGINSNRTAAEQTAAVNIATGLIADMRLAPTEAAIIAARAATPSVILNRLSPTRHLSVSSASSPVTTTYYLDESGGPYVQTGDANDKQPTALAVDSRYRVSVTMLPAAAPRTATQASITVSWPAAAVQVNASNSVTMFVALDRN